MGKITDSCRSAYMGINSLFEHFVTKETMVMSLTGSYTCLVKGIVDNSPIYDFYVTCFWMNFKLKYVSGSEVKLQVHRLMAMTTHCSRNIVGSCLCTSHVISSYRNFCGDTCNFE